MSPIQTNLQKVFIECLQTMLVPIVRLTLHCGLGHSEFSAAVRRVFIDVASQEYGVRGRPANVSRIAAKTGLPRKVVRTYRLQATQQDWTPDDEVNPINTIIHYWRYDDRFCKSSGKPRELSLEGKNGFSSLVKAYGGDIPVSAIRQELLREEIASYTNDGLLKLRREYSFPENLDEDFLRNAAFSIRHLGDTLVHNAQLVESGSVSERDHVERGWFERFAWSRRLVPRDVKAFQLWARAEGAVFIERAAEFISRHEALDDDSSGGRENLSGVGVYFFGE